MSELVLTTLKVVFLALLYLFIARAIRIIWLDLAGPRAPKPKRAAAAAAATPATAPRRSVRVPASKSNRGGTGGAPTSLVVIEENLPPRTVPLRDLADVTIGRADECTIPLKDTYVSQMHTRMFSKDGAWQVTDLGSTNGTYLNKIRIGDPSPLRAGDEVRLGKTIIEVRGS